MSYSEPAPKPETQPARPVLLVLYADGEISVPHAQTYDDVLAPMKIIAREAKKIRKRLRSIPLRQPEPPKAAP